MAFLDKIEGENGDEYAFFCPGCQETHNYSCRKDRVGSNDPERPMWGFNGNLESPTFTPSLHYPSRRRPCHLYVENGMIRFLPDCFHELRGQTVPMVDWPEGYHRCWLPDTPEKAI